MHCVAPPGPVRTRAALSGVQLPSAAGPVVPHAWEACGPPRPAMRPMTPGNSITAPVSCSSSLSAPSRSYVAPAPPIALPGTTRAVLSDSIRIMPAPPPVVTDTAVSSSTLPASRPGSLSHPSSAYRAGPARSSSASRTPRSVPSPARHMAPPTPGSISGSRSHTPQLAQRFQGGGSLSSRIDNLADTMRSTQSLSNRGMEEFSIGANLESSLLWDRQIYIMELENQLKAAKVRASSLNTELAEFRDAAEQQSKQMAAFRGRISELEEIVAKNTVSESTLRRELEKEAGEAQAAYRRRILEVEEALANTSAFDTKHRTQRAELEKEVLEAKGSQRRIAELGEELLQLKVTLKRPN